MEGNENEEERDEKGESDQPLHLSVSYEWRNSLEF